MDVTTREVSAEATGQEIVLKIIPIVERIVRPVLLGSPRILMFRAQPLSTNGYIGERQDGLHEGCPGSGMDCSDNDVAEDVSEVRTWMHTAYGIARPLEIPTRHIGLNLESKYEVTREVSWIALD